MANPSVTYSFVNSQTSDGTQVNQNFTDLINALIDGSKDLTVANLTVNTAFIAKGTTQLGDATTDTIDPQARFINHLITATSATYDLGATSVYWRNLYISGGFINSGGTLSLPSATDTLVGKATTDVFTNKSISGSTNTLSNIADGSLSTSYIKADGSRALSATWDAGQIIKYKGVTDASAASAGYIGELITSFSGGGASPVFTTAAATTTYNDCASITLAAGDYDIWAAGEARLNTATGFTAMSFGISTTSGNSSTGLVSGQSIFGLAAFPTANVDSQFHISPIPVSVNGSTTYYLKQNYTYTGGLPEARATMWARRRR